MDGKRDECEYGNRAKGENRIRRRESDEEFFGKGEFEDLIAAS